MCHKSRNRISLLGNRRTNCADSSKFLPCMCATCNKWKVFLALLSLYKLFTLQMMQPVSIHSVYRVRRKKDTETETFKVKIIHNFARYRWQRREKYVKCMMMCFLPLESSFGSNFHEMSETMRHQKFPSEKIFPRCRNIMKSSTQMLNQLSYSNSFR